MSDTLIRYLFIKPQPQTQEEFVNNILGLEEILNRNLIVFNESILGQGHSTRIYSGSVVVIDEVTITPNREMRNVTLTGNKNHGNKVMGEIRKFFEDSGYSLYNTKEMQI